MDARSRFDAAQGPRVVGPRDGASVSLGAICGPVHGVG